MGRITSHPLTVAFCFVAVVASAACVPIDFQQPAAERQQGGSSKASAKAYPKGRESSPGSRTMAKRNPTASRHAHGSPPSRPDQALRTDTEPARDAPSEDELLAGDEPSMDEPLPPLARSALQPRPGQDGNRVIDDLIVAQRSDAGSADSPHGARSRSVVRVPLHDVFFPFDSMMIEEGGRDALTRNAETAKAAPVVRIVVEGHCDERGSQSYNLVLGEKRAQAVRAYLADLGIDASQIETVSYGEERPFCTEHDETCYQQNRRGHIWMEQEVTDQLTQLAP